ncbi:SIMPL domain-containing protein [Campylobacter portucalensis]|nr:SIMPL domain-containing protein [Campylobacter portucalensis]
MGRILYFFIFICLNLYAEGLLSVYGKGSLKVDPDSLIVSMQIFTQGKNLVDAKDKNDEISKKVEEILYKNGIEKDQIQIENLNIYSRQDYESKDLNSKFYEASKNINLHLKTLQNHIDLINSLLKIGISSINLNYTRSDFNNQKNLALQEALKEAKQKAVMLATTANKNLGDILEIEELISNTLPYFTKSAQDFSENLNGVIIVDSKVKVKFKLNP